jgi:hypothetical protein
MQSLMQLHPTLKATVMKKEVYLQIPEPCHEDWNVMSPVEQGRFCKNCQKQVVDFRDMTDKEILNILSKATGSTCGRFTNLQLDKPLIKEAPPVFKPYKFFLSAFIPVVLLADKATSQELSGKVKAYEKPLPPPPTSMGMVAFIVPSITGSITLSGGEPAAGVTVKIKGTDLKTTTDKYGRFWIDFPRDKTKAILQVQTGGYDMKEVEVAKNKLKSLHIKLSKKDVALTGLVLIAPNERHIDSVAVQEPETKNIKGRIVTENGEPLPRATIQVNSTKQTIIADGLGRFSLQVNSNSDSTEITATYIGFEPVSKSLNINDNTDSEISIAMKPSVLLGDVVVISYPKTKCTAIVGGVSIVEKITIADTINRFVAKAFKNEMFKVFPNPAVKASNVNITFKEQGTYTLQLIDNAAKLYLLKDIQVNAKQTSQLLLPSNISAGTYYIKAINGKTQKQFADKIIIQ